MITKVKANPRGLRQILTVESQPLVTQLASRIEGSISTAVGQVDGRGVEIDRHDNADPGQARFRVALVLKHPTAKGRQAANRAADAALRIAGT